MNLTPTFRRFHLQRNEDISGVSGLGRIAEGCVFSNGAVVIEWLSACASTNRYGNLESVLQVHGHGGATRIIFDDPDPREEKSDVLESPAVRKKILKITKKLLSLPKAKKPSTKKSARKKTQS